MLAVALYGGLVKLVDPGTGVQKWATQPTTPSKYSTVPKRHSWEYLGAAGRSRVRLVPKGAAVRGWMHMVVPEAMLDAPGDAQSDAACAWWCPERCWMRTARRCQERGTRCCTQVRLDRAQPEVDDSDW
jgi:hypothetical protein